MLTEFGGIALESDAGKTWGYSVVGTPHDLLKQYSALLGAVRSLPALAGFCYTQFTDTYQEAEWAGVCGSEAQGAAGRDCAGDEWDQAG